jgi:hypothetical protein
MPIPPTIEREHLFQAMLKIRNEGIPLHRNAERWVLEYEGFQYPCKLLISWGHLYAHGVELDPDPSNFQTQAAQRYLVRKGFINIVQI